MGKQQLLKAHNRVVILNTIRQFGPISRADVARRTGLAVGTVTGLTGELIKNGLIYEKQEGASSGGRPPILLALQPDGVYVVGLKLTEDHITMALTNLDADVVDRTTIRLTQTDISAVADCAAAGITGLLQNADIPTGRLIGVGIGLAGIVDTERGVCRSSPILGWKNVPFASLVEQRTNFPVYLDNDVNTLTLVEKLYGIGRGKDHFLIITVGRGVGLGIVANGQIYRGLGGAGEFAHIVIDASGYVCDCGQRGCLQTFVGDPWLLRRAAERLLNVASIDEFSAAAHAGNPIALDILNSAAETLGSGVAMLANVLNPQLLIFSGEGMRYGELLLAPLRTALFARILPGLEEGLELHVEPLGDDAWARGAASLVLHELFRTSQPGLADLERARAR